MKQATVTRVRKGVTHAVEITQPGQDDGVWVSEHYQRGPSESPLPNNPRGLFFGADTRLGVREVAELRDVLTRWLETGKLS